MQSGPSFLLQDAAARLYKLTVASYSRRDSGARAKAINTTPGNWPSSAPGELTLFFFPYRRVGAECARERFILFQPLAAVSSSKSCVHIYIHIMYTYILYACIHCIYTGVYIYTTHLLLTRPSFMALGNWINYLVRGW